MINFLSYLRAQLKRALKLYPAIIAFTLALIVGVSLILAALFGSREGNEENMRIKVGIVGDLDNSYLDIGIAALQSMDTSRFYIEFQEMEESVAQKQLANGSLKGYVKIPKGFVDSVADGGDLKLKYYMGNSPAVLSALLMQEVIDVIGSVVTESQCAVYGYMDLLEKAGFSRSVQNRMAEGLSVEYLGKILTREEWYEISDLGFGSGLSFEGYYAAAFLVILFMLWGTICVNLLTKRDLSLERLMLSKGRGITALMLAEYIPFFLIFVANLLIIGAGAAVFLGGKELPAFLPEFAGFFSFLKFAAMLLPAALLISAVQFLLYELTASVVSAVLLQILALVGLSYASGLLYPLYSLPETLQKVAAILPTGVAFNYVSAVLTSSRISETLIKTLLYAAAFLAVSVLVRKIKIRGSRI